MVDRRVYVAAMYSGLRWSLADNFDFNRLYPLNGKCLLMPRVQKKFGNTETVSFKSEIRLIVGH
jgi:hypothetical protein